jgi:hypothetical protein
VDDIERNSKMLMVLHLELPRRDRRHLKLLESV